MLNIMKRKNKILALGLNKFLFTICLALSSSGIFSQDIIAHDDSVFVKLFDADLKEQAMSYSKFFAKPTVIISPVNCVACTEYFTKAKKNFNFVFVLSDESLGEIKGILAHYGLKKGEVFFTTCKNLIKVNQPLCSNQTPCMVYKKKKLLYFLNYNELNKETNKFSAEIKKLKNKLDNL